MAQQYRDQTLETPSAIAPPPLSRTSSGRRLNADAPVFVPLSAPPPVFIRHPGPPGPHGFVAPPPISNLAVPPPPPGLAYLYEYFGGGGGGFGEQEARELPDEPDRLSDEVTRAIVKQVEYYFTDLNLVTTDQLRRRISEDPEGYVPMQVIANFKKIKDLVCKNSLLADALRTSSRLVVSDDGKRVRRNHPFTNSDVEELHLRIVVAENLPDNHNHGSLMTIFSRAGRVKNIRTRYPPITNGTAPATNSSMDMLFGHKVHAFVEYETVEDAERAVAELNEEGNWRRGLRVRCLHRCLTRHAPGRGRKVGCEGDGNVEDASTKHQPNKKQVDYPSQSPEALKFTGENGLNEREGGGARHPQGRGRGARGRGRVVYQNNSYHHRSEGHVSGNPPSSHTVRNEVTKQPPGPRMPDGTRGFTMGRGEPIAPNSTGS